MPSKDVPQRLADIVEYAERVVRYVTGRDRETFLADDMARDAILVVFNVFRKLQRNSTWKPNG